MTKGPQPGDPAPPFSLPSTDGNFVLTDRLADGPVLLVFYPGDQTPTCTKQMCDYRDNLEVFATLGVQVVGLNGQSVESHDRFTDAHELPFPLLADEGKKVCKEWGAVGWFGMVKRALFLIDADGIVRYRKVDLPMFHQSADALRTVLAEIVGTESEDSASSGAESASNDPTSPGATT